MCLGWREIRVFFSGVTKFFAWFIFICFGGFGVFLEFRICFFVFFYLGEEGFVFFLLRF